MYVEYKPGEKHAAVNADRSDHPELFQDCGLMLGNDEVVIDIDHLPKESIKAMLQEFEINTQVVWTQRGAHLYFKKAANFTRRRDGVCKLGFQIEQHTATSRPSGMTIKRNGVMRTIENEGMREVMPDVFEVGTGKHKYDDLTGLDEGDGRNNKLFKHRQQLGDCKGWEKIVTFINNHVFATPMASGELDSITREMDISQSLDDKYRVATAIINKYHITMWAGSLWWYNGTEYVADDGNGRLIRRVYDECAGEDSKYVDEILKQIKYRCDMIGAGETFAIRFRNGILDRGRFIPRRQFIEFTPYFIDIDYVPDAEPVKDVDDYLVNLSGGDEKYKELLMEALGFALVTDPERVRSLGKFFFFRGDGANGKGTLLQIISRILNPVNCTNLSIKQLADERYQVTMLGKLANLGDDIEAAAITDTQMKMLKNISTADSITTRKLYSQSMSATFTTKLYFTTNHDIKSWEKGYAYRRRVMWLPMFTKVPVVDPNFITKLTTPDALRYWIRLIVDGYFRLYKNNGWTTSDKVEEYNEMYHENNDPMHMFAKDLSEDEICGHTITEMEDAFSKWNTDDIKFNKKQFKAAVWDEYKMGIGKARVDGKISRVFMKQAETTQVLDH